MGVWVAVRSLVVAPLQGLIRVLVESQVEVDSNAVG